MLLGLRVACVLAVSLAAGAVLAADEKRPNVVIVLADDLGYGDPRVYNPQSKIPTPNIDRLAAAGMRFTDAHTPSSVCTPTRYGLLTGRYPWRSRLKSGVLDGYSRALIEPGRTTIATLLTGQGYRTACIGKWHLGLGDAEPADFSGPLDPGPLAAGFAESFILSASLDMPPYVYVHNGHVTAALTAQAQASKMRRHGGGGFWRAGPSAPGFDFTAVLPTFERRAIDFVREQSADKPFFLYLPLTAPHTPWMPTEEFRGRSGAGYYGDFVAQVDSTLGKLLDALDERRLTESTIVIFTSDNGAHWGPGDIENYGHRANAPWRGQKADIWEGGHRVPFIVRWPGAVKPNSTSDQLVCLTDVLATVAEITAQSLPAGQAEDSISFLNALQETAPADSPGRESLVHAAIDGTLAIRHSNWKLVPKLGSRGFSQPSQVAPVAGDPPGQLYDLQADPGEMRNQWHAEPAVVERLERLLRELEQGATRPAAG